MKLKRKLAILLAFAMVITSVNVPEAAKEAKAAAGDSTMEITSITKDGTEVTVGVKVTIVADDVDTYKVPDSDPATVQLQLSAEDDDDNDVGSKVVKTATKQASGDDYEAEMEITLPISGNYTLNLNYNKGTATAPDYTSGTITNSALTGIAINTYIPVIDLETATTITSTEMARPLAGKITGLDRKAYTLYIQSTEAGTSTWGRVSVPVSSLRDIYEDGEFVRREYDLSNIDLSDIFTNYTAKSDTLKISVVLGNHSEETPDSLLVYASVTGKSFKWNEIEAAKITAEAVGQHSIVASVAIPATMAETLGDQFLSYRIYTNSAATGTAISVGAYANAGNFKFTEENATYPNFTRISHDNLEAGKTYYIALYDEEGTRISDMSTGVTLMAAEADVEYKNDGTVFSPTLFTRLLQTLKYDEVITDEKAETFKQSDLEKLLDENQGILDLHLATNSQKVALSDLTGLQQIKGIMQVNLANNNIADANLTPEVIGALRYVSKINLSGNRLTAIPDFTTLTNLGNPSKPANVNLKYNAIPAAQFTKEVYATKFAPEVIGKVQTTEGWARIRQMGLTQKVGIAPIITVEKQYTAMGQYRPLVVTITGAAAAQKDAEVIKYYLTVKKGETFIKSQVIGKPNGSGTFKYVFTDIDRELLPDGENQLTFILEPKRANYAGAVLTETVTYTTAAASLTVDEVGYGHVKVSGATSGTALTREGLFEQSTDLKLQVSKNKKFRTVSNTVTVSDINGAFEATASNLDQNTTYFLRLVRVIDGVNYPLTEAVKAKTKNSGVKVKATKIKTVKGYNYIRKQSDIKITLPKKGNLVVSSVRAGFYGENGYTAGTVGSVAHKHWYSTYHIDATVSYASKNNVRKVYAYVTIKDLDTDEEFEIMLGDNSSAGLTAYKKIKGTLKVTENKVFSTKFAGKITGSKINSDLNVYVKVSSASSFDLPTDKEKKVVYRNGRYEETIYDLKENSSYNVKLYVEKPDGSEKVLKTSTFTTPANPIAATVGDADFALTPGIANAIATVTVNTNVIDKDYAITGVEGKFSVYGQENAREDDKDIVYVDDAEYDGTSRTLAADGKYTLTAKLSENVYDDTTNKVFVKPVITVNWKNKKTGKTGSYDINSIPVKAVDKLADIDNQIALALSATEVTDYKAVLNGQFTYANMAGTAIANLGNMMDYQIKVYGPEDTDETARVYAASKSAFRLREGTIISTDTKKPGFTLYGLQANTTYRVVVDQFVQDVVDGVPVVNAAGKPVKTTPKTLTTFEFKTAEAPAPAPAEAQYTLNIPDVNLLKAVEEELIDNGFETEDGKALITKDSVAYITSLYATVSGYADDAEKIKDLTGIEGLFNLQRIYLRGNAVSNVAPLNKLDNLTYVDLSYNDLTAVPALNRVDNLDIVLTGNSIPGLEKQITPNPVLLAADTYYAIDEEDAGADIESIETVHPFYFEISGLDNYNYTLTVAAGENTILDAARLSNIYGNYYYAGYNQDDIIDTLIQEGKIVLGTPVAISFKVERNKTSDPTGEKETVLEETRNITFAAEDKSVAPVVDNTEIILGSKSYTGKITVPNQLLFNANSISTAAEKVLDDYDIYEKEVDFTIYDGELDEDSASNYYDYDEEFNYGREEKQTAEPGKDKETAIKVYLLDAAGNKVLRGTDNGYGTTSRLNNNSYAVKFNDSEAEEILLHSAPASYINFEFDNTQKQFKSLQAGTYSLQYVLADGTVGTLPNAVTVKAQNIKEVTPVVRTIETSMISANKVRVYMYGTEFDSSKVRPVIYVKADGVMTPVGTLTGTKIQGSGTAAYEYVLDPAWGTTTKYYVGIGAEAGYAYQRKGSFEKNDYIALGTLPEPSTTPVCVSYGYNKNNTNAFEVYIGLRYVAAATPVTAKLYAYTKDELENQYVVGEASGTVASDGSISLQFTKDGAAVDYVYGHTYTVEYTVGTYVGRVNITPINTTFDYTRVVDDVRFSGRDYYIANGAKKVNLAAYMTTTAVKGKKVKVTAELWDCNGYIEGSAVKLKVTNVKNTPYSKVSGTFGGKKTKLAYGTYTVHYFINGEEISGHGETIANDVDKIYDVIHVVDLASDNYYQTNVDAFRNADGSITVTADTVRAKALNAKKFKAELFDEDGDEIENTKVTAKIAKAKNQITFTITGAENAKKVYGNILYNGKYPLDYVQKQYDGGQKTRNTQFNVSGYEPLYRLGEVVNGTKKSTTVIVKAASAGAVLKIYKAEDATLVKEIAIPNVGETALKASDLEGVDLGYRYDYAIVDYKGVGRAVGTSYFYADTKVVKTAEGASTPVTGIQTNVKGKSLGLAAGSKFTLAAYASPANLKDLAVKYQTSNKKVATVSKDGVIAAKKAGKAVIKITAKNNKKLSTKVTVTVGPKATKVTAVKAVKNSVKVSWKKAKKAKNAKVSGYIVYMSSSEDGTYKQVAKVGAKKTSATIKKGIKAGKTYFFKVAPYTKVGKNACAGKISDAKSVKVPAKKAKATKKTNKKSNKKSNKKTTKKSNKKSAKKSNKKSKSKKKK